MLFTKISKVFVGIIIFRLLSWLIVRTYFIADEYWQTFEIAHSLAFGYGYKTWEWKSDIAIRSYLYPFIISLIYRIIAIFHLDTVSILVNAATLFQTLLAIIGDFAYLKFLQGHKLIFLILLCRFSCWYTMYSSPRLIINNLEEILFICSLAAAKNFQSSSNIMFHALVSLSFIIRPTSAIPFVIIYPYLLYKSSSRFKFLFQAFLCFILLNTLNILLDSYMYNQWTFVPLNFFYINFLHPKSISSHYGINSILWYLTNGLPMIFFYRLPFIFVGSIANKRLTSIILFTIFIYTLNAHKEFRFLTQILPILFILEAHGIDWCLKIFKWNRFRWIIFASFIGQLVIGIYFSLIDRQGQISVMQYLRTNLISNNKENLSIDFLMPCHSTPYYSCIHRNDIQLNFLTCEPNLDSRNNNYMDEADRFFSRPIESLKKRLNTYNSSHLVMFDTLYNQVKDVLEEDQWFFVKEILFNSHIQHTSRHGKTIYILEKR
ncbi:unnamed protein product [Rotaria magnacalcarata]|uniref:Mannosyltransferase n=2 Tax=Rotaria magnacalcarata TaxID=392030 RepID=A0A815G4B7_9BILA|nr:unnamed protein product [Rotaria magnacalcarata]CAF1655315.1 unnamed protein product [Rotaria magnacalcarata]CAF1931997.1 unnamed protein product [Rotaria magnacalcarata]CAF2035622.1 unnamed protein product [Rotaria magnacalcarata]CAF3988303.1 unnamed protein product [Rotaria magnacalcarata]